MRATLQEAWKLRGNSKAVFFILAFRTSQSFTKNVFLRVAGWPIRNLYRFIVIWLLGIEVPDRTPVGRGLELFHGQGLVINENSFIGENVRLRHTTTIGNAREGGPCPRLGDHVDVGAHSVIIGGIRIGDHSVIGAGSVVIHDVPPYTVVAGNPARVIRRLKRPRA